MLSSPIKGYFRDEFLPEISARWDKKIEEFSKEIVHKLDRLSFTGGKKRKYFILNLFCSSFFNFGGTVSKNTSTNL
jgi:hypothetical protein